MQPFGPSSPTKLRVLMASMWVFSQRFWLLVRDSVRKVVKKAFFSCKVLEFLNQTLVTVILKCSSPVHLNNYRPISLYNTTYKMITKIIVARIRPFKTDLVFPFQTTIVPRRKGVDNAIIFQEMIHTISRKKGRTEVMEIMIDLEKAYDRLEWGFIRDPLNLFQFPSQLVSLIMSCVSSSSILILFNSGAFCPFLPSRGIR